MGQKVSVIMPVYNAETYLAECLESIVRQTYREWELICVDDGSTDGSCALIEELKEKDPRVFLIRGEHRNAGAARNLGMAAAKGKYLLFLDADDFMEPDMMRQIVLRAEKTAADLVLYGVFVYHDGTGEREKASWMLKTDLLPPGGVFSPREISRYVFHVSGCNPWSKLFSREMITRNKIRFQEIERANDVVFTCLALASSERISALDLPLINYRVDNGSSLQGMDKGRSMHFYQALLELKRELRSRKLWEPYKQSFVNLSYVQCINELNDRKNYQDYVYLFNRIKEECFSALEVLGKEETYFYETYLYNQYQQIIHNSAEQGLMLQMQHYKQKFYEWVKQDERKERQVRELLRRLEETKTKIWAFPYDLVSKGSRVVIYGAGSVGQDYYTQVTASGYAEVVRWVDRQYEEYRKQGLAVDPPSVIDKEEADQIVIAVRNHVIAEEIRRYLESLGLAPDRILLPR